MGAARQSQGWHKADKSILIGEVFTIVHTLASVCWATSLAASNTELRLQ